MEASTRMSVSKSLVATESLGSNTGPDMSTEGRVKRTPKVVAERGEVAAE